MSTGSCTAQTCWYQLPPFREVANELHYKYERAIQLPASSSSSLMASGYSQHGPFGAKQPNSLHSATGSSAKSNKKRSSNAGFSVAARSTRELATRADAPGLAGTGGPAEPWPPSLLANGTRGGGMVLISPRAVSRFAAKRHVEGDVINQHQLHSINNHNNNKNDDDNHHANDHVSINDAPPVSLSMSKVASPLEPYDKDHYSNANRTSSPDHHNHDHDNHTDSHSASNLLNHQLHHLHHHLLHLEAPSNSYRNNDSSGNFQSQSQPPSHSQPHIAPDYDQYNKPTPTHQISSASSGDSAPAATKRRPVARSIRQETQRIAAMPSQLDLIYQVSSPNFCERSDQYNIKGTRGRVCSDNPNASDRCDKLCCGRGFKTDVREEEYNCECIFRFCCELVCKKCTRRKVINKCL